MEAVEFSVVPCSRGRRSTTAWPRGVIFSGFFLSFGTTSSSVTREIKREELAEFLGPAGQAPGRVCVSSGTCSSSPPKADKHSKAKGAWANMKWDSSSWQRWTRSAESLPPLLLKCYS